MRLTSLAGTGGRQLARRNGSAVGVADATGVGRPLALPDGTVVVWAADPKLWLSAGNAVGADAEGDSRGMPARDRESAPGVGGQMHN